MLNAGDDGGNAVGQIGGKGAQVADDGRKAQREEDCECEEGEAQQQRNGSRAVNVAAVAQLEVHEAVDHRHQHHGEQSADVHQQQNLTQPPGQRQRQQHAECEEDVAAHGTAGVVRGRRRERQHCFHSGQMLRLTLHPGALGERLSRGR